MVCCRYILHTAPTAPPICYIPTSYGVRYIRSNAQHTGLRYSGIANPPLTLHEIHL